MQITSTLVAFALVATGALSQVLDPNLQFQHGGVKGPVCISASDSFDGAPVVITLDCNNPPANSTWINNAGALQIFGNKCLDVTNGVDENGTKLQVWTCFQGNTNQNWQIINSSDGTGSHIIWTGSKSNAGRCVDLTDGRPFGGTPLQIWDCIGDNTNQQWNMVQGSTA